MPPSRKPVSRPNRPAPHKIRIIGGRFKRTPIPVLDLAGLRPTPDRVRETLFNWLNHLWDSDFSQKAVLDPFAGSGALGFEAASRGVGQVTMIEHDRRAAAALHALQARLKADNVHIVTGDALAVVPRLAHATFDLVFLDPPFGQDWVNMALPIVKPVLAPNGLLYIEAEMALEAPDGTELLRQDKAGTVYFHLFKVQTA